MSAFTVETSALETAAKRFDDLSAGFQAVDIWNVVHTVEVAMQNSQTGAAVNSAAQSAKALTDVLAGQSGSIASAMRASGVGYHNSESFVSKLCDDLLSLVSFG